MKIGDHFFYTTTIFYYWELTKSEIKVVPHANQIFWNEILWVLIWSEKYYLRHLWQSYVLYSYKNYRSFQKLKLIYFHYELHSTKKCWIRSCKTWGNIRNIIFDFPPTFEFSKDHLDTYMNYNLYFKKNGWNKK